MTETAVITVEPTVGRPAGWPDLIVLENVPSRVKTALATGSPPVVFNVIKFWSGISHPILDQVDEVTVSTTATAYNYLNFTLPFTDYAYGDPYTVNSLTHLDVTVRALGGTITSGLPSGDSTVRAYNYPAFQSLSIERCLSDGTLDDDGTYIKIDFTALVAKNPYNHYSIVAKYRKVGDTPWTTLTLSDSSGVLSDTGWLKNQTFTRSLVTGAGAFSGDYSYEVQLTFGDDIKTLTPQVVSIPTAFTTMDFLAGGTGIAFGKVATQVGFDLAMPLTVQDPAQARAALHAQQTLSEVTEVGINRAALSGFALAVQGNVDINGDIDITGDIIHNGNSINSLATKKVLMGTATSTGGMPNTAGSAWRWTDPQTVTFEEAFSSPPIVIANISDTSGVTASHVRGKTTTGFLWTGLEYGTADTGRNVKIDWIAIGE